MRQHVFHIAVIEAECGSQIVPGRVAVFTI